MGWGLTPGRTLLARQILTTEHYPKSLKFQVLRGHGKELPGDHGHGGAQVEPGVHLAFEPSCPLTWLLVPCGYRLTILDL